MQDDRSFSRVAFVVSNPVVARPVGISWPEEHAHAQMLDDLNEGPSRLELHVAGVQRLLVSHMNAITGHVYNLMR